MLRYFVFLLLASLLSVSLSAQKSLSWKKHRKLGDELMRQGEFYQAAQNYEQAWQKKSSKTELIYQAAEAYYVINDYRAAAEAYQHVADRRDLDPLVGLKYARSLKQDGQYDKAIQVFRDVSDNYTGQDKAILDDIIQMEIQGAEMAGQLAARQDRKMEISYPGKSINTAGMEFAPFPVTPDLVYYSSSAGGKARIYSSQRQGDSWTKGDIPGNFPVIQNGQYANGALTPDGSRFYFTICSDGSRWDQIKTRCELFVIRREGTNWTQPERLPDYINMDGVTSTHPYAVHVSGREIIYFSSNREGGRGGMDIWYVVRDLGTENNDFTFPVNLGPVVNTLGEEITPFYDPEEGALYFSSNGHPSIGGYDIFRSLGEEVSWTIPENIGLPANSSANDYGFIMNRPHSGGFLVSNRPFGGQKNNTHDTDIFEFNIGGNRLVLKGNVYDKENGELLSDISVSLYQLFDDGSENLLITKPFINGSYLFELLPDRRFRLEVQRSGYAPQSYFFQTDDPNVTTYGQPVFLNAAELSLPDQPIVNTPPVTAPSTGTRPDARPTNPRTDDDFGTTTTSPTRSPVSTRPAGTKYTARGTSPKDNLEYVTSAPQHEGVYYKIQVAALSRYNPDNSKIAQIRDIGRIDTEEIVGSDLTRVLLADFFTVEEAKAALRQAQYVFDRAYIVKYENGLRYGKVRL